MLQRRLLYPLVPIAQQLGQVQSPVVLINVFTVHATDVANAAALLETGENDADWMTPQSGCISTLLHRGIGGSCVYLNCAAWKSVAHFRQTFTHPDFIGALPAYPSSAVGSQHLFEKPAVAKLLTV